jgi:hypothetical protein
VVPTIAAFKEVGKATGDGKTYDGNVNMLDYLSLRPVTLHIEVHQMPCPKDGKLAVFFAVSPQPKAHAIWQKFKVVQEGFRCSK